MQFEATTRRAPRRATYVDDDNLEGIRVKIPDFLGKPDPNAYMEWETKVDAIFAIHDYSETNKVRSATVALTEYALLWWGQFHKDLRRYNEPLVSTWEEMKTILRRRFVPSHYIVGLYTRFFELSQGSKTLEEYYMEMEVLMMQANIEENPKTTMFRYQGGLNREIQDVVELNQYEDVLDMVHHATKVYQVLERRRRRVIKREEASSSSKHGQQSMILNTDDVICRKCQGKGHYAQVCSNTKTVIMLGGEYLCEESDDEGSQFPETKYARFKIW